ncbi:hypothetical protein LXL04_014164 [Taraxacum kok-saghyz]
MDQNEARSTQDATIRNDIPQNKCKPKRKRMKQRSAGWDHFVKYTDKDGSTRARCKYCPDKSFACDSISNGCYSTSSNNLCAKVVEVLDHKDMENRSKRRVENDDNWKVLEDDLCKNKRLGKKDQPRKEMRPWGPTV